MVSLLIWHLLHAAYRYTELKTPFEVYIALPHLTRRTKLFLVACAESDQMEGILLWRAKVLLQCALHFACSLDY